VMEEGIEVNLGNSDEGLGDIAPQIPGEPAAAKEEVYSPPAQSAPASPVAQEENIQGDENEAEDAPVVNKNPKPVVRKTVPTPVPAKPKAIEQPVTTNTAVKPRQNTQPVTNPTPAPPQPKAIYKGGSSNGPGGNGADTYNGVRNQGIAGGRGDQGSPNGNPNSDSYKGNAANGNSGVKIRSGLSGRRFTRLP